MIAKERYDGHALPLRVEVREGVTGAIALIVDADHRCVPVPSRSFDCLLRFVAKANSTMTEAWSFRSRTPAIWLTVPERLALGHPVANKPAIISTALECLIFGSLTHWFGPAMIAQLRLYEVVDEAGKPTKTTVARWLRWRQREDDALVAKGITEFLSL
jgi:hypothetical protein